MAGVEGQATGSTQQRERTWREPDPGSVDDVADTESSGLGRVSHDVYSKDAGTATEAGKEWRHDGNATRGIGAVDWGKYAPAIQRWESVLDRPAPAPTVIRNDKRRLNPQFVEWMMGLPDGWVTGHGLSAAKELKMLGNGVVPQQAYAAITQLMQRVNT